MSVTRSHVGPRMSQIVTHGDTIYLAGQVAADFSADVKEQTRSVLEKIDALLAEAGSSNQNMLSVTIYVRDMKDFASMNEVWDAWVPQGHTPARACVQAPMAAPDILVEMSVVAAKG
ncbi:RidA family protein [Rhodovibrionaceae bacterium A322]